MLEIINEKEKIIVKISGEIDHHFAREIREEIDSSLEHCLPKILNFDFSNVDFMDSSGIGLIMGRYKLIRSMNGKILITNARDNIKRILLMAGIDRIAEIDESEE